MGGYKVGGEVDKYRAVWKTAWPVTCIPCGLWRGCLGWGSWKYLEIIIPIESVIFFFFNFLFWCPVEHIWIFISSFSPDWAITGLFGFFSPSGNWIFLAFISYVFIQASAVCGFLPQFPREHFALQMTCTAYWEVQASAPVMFLIVLQVESHLPSWLWKCFRKPVSPRAV